MSEEKKPILYPENQEVTFFMPDTNSIAVLKKAEKTRNLTATYMTVEEWEKVKGVEKRCVFLGMKPCIDSQGEGYYMAKLHDGTKPFVAAQTILIETLMQVKDGQGVSITCTDVIKNSKNGKTVMFDVAELDFNVFPKNEE